MTFLAFFRDSHLKNRVGFFVKKIIYFSFSFGFSLDSDNFCSEEIDELQV
jgi:hypothetical protein